MFPFSGLFHRQWNESSEQVFQKAKKSLLCSEKLQINNLVITSSIASKYL
jgi:hypothetical protein